MSDLPGYPLGRVAVTLVTGEERFNKCKGEPFVVGAGHGVVYSAAGSSAVTAASMAASVITAGSLPGSGTSVSTA